MIPTVRHFALNADDVGRAKAFFENAFGWTFNPWGPPGFYQTRSAGPGVMGALQGRRGIGGHVMPEVELTFAVDDIEEWIRRIEAAGGAILMAPFHIETVGRLAFFRDTEGNIAGVMQYEPGMTPSGESPPGAARFSGFGIHADDVGRAKAFCEGVFGWTFTPWGPPDFYTCGNAGEGVSALLQARHTVDGRVLPGIEVTFAVDEIVAAAAKVRAAGGQVLTAPYHIEGVGHHVFIATSEGGVFALMQHETEARA